MKYKPNPKPRKPQSDLIVFVEPTSERTTIKLNLPLSKQLIKVANAKQECPSYLVAQALKKYLGLQINQTYLSKK